MLSSDADREAVLGRLRASHVHGVLGADTYEQRVEATLRATHRAQLHALLADLPSRRGVVRDAVASLARGRGTAGDLDVVLPGWTEAPVVLGRSRACDVVLTDGAVSARHAELRALTERDRWLLVDLGSLNGTWFLGRRVGRTVVQAGDQVLVGRTAVVLVPS